MYINKLKNAFRPWYYLIRDFTPSRAYANSTKITYPDLKAFGEKFNRNDNTLIVYIEVVPFEQLFTNFDILPKYTYDCERYYPLLENIPDNSYEAVVAMGILEHMQDPARFIKECHRILAPGGKLYISASSVFSVHRGPDDYFHVTQFGMQVLLDTCSWTTYDIKGSCQPFQTIAVLLQRILLQSETYFFIRPIVFFLVKTLPVFDKFILNQYSDRSFSPAKRIDSMTPSNIQVIATK